MNVVTRGIRNAFRNTIRTFSIIVILGLSVGLSLAMLIAHQAVGKKIESIKSSTGNTISVSPAGFRGFGGGTGDPLTQDQINKIVSLANVTSVTESLTDRLTSSDTNLVSAVDAGALGERFASRSGQTFTAPPENQIGGGGQASGSSATSGNATVSFTPPINITGTNAPTNLSSTEGGGTFNLTSGSVFSANSSENVALIGSSLATKNNLGVGSTFTAYSGTVITVAGIFDAGNTFSNNQIIMPLTTVQTLSGQAGNITSATVNVNSISNVSSVATAISDTLGSTTVDVTNNAESAQSVVAPLENIQSISLYSLIGAVVAGSVIILLTMIMIVRERRREIGVLKAIGASNVKVMTQFMTEAVTLTFLGAVLGTVIGVVAGNPITKMLVNNSTNSSTQATTTVGRGAGRAFSAVSNNISDIHAVIGWQIVLYGLGAALIIAVVGSAVASFFIAKVRPAEVMRAE